MALYEFQSKTGEKIEKNFPMGKCPKTTTHNGVRYTRIFSVPFMAIDSTQPKTIGELAEKNTKEREKMGLNPKKKKKENPFWRPNKSKPNLSLTKKTPAQLQKYLMTGE